MQLDPTNPVAQVFIRKIGMHPAEFPLPERSVGRAEPPEPDAGQQFILPARTRAQRIYDAWWFQVKWQ